MNFIGTGARLKDEDFPRIGHGLGVGEDEMHAVLDVEARGVGFDKLNRLPMLFEPHVFWRELGPGVRRTNAERLGLAYERWGTQKYPKDSYPRLQLAREISETAALRSASWAMPQIMGFNCSLAGYGSAKEMVLDFLTGEAAQVEAMVRFIKTAGLDDELRAHDWHGFARGYNGPKYEKHGYHLKLAARFAWWQKKPDTPWTPNRTPIDPNACFAVAA